MKISTRASAVVAAAIAVATMFPAAAQEAHRDRMALSPEAAAFLAENDDAMARMMAAMHVAPTGDVDRDFVTMMIPHHQGAVDMARAVLRSSRNEAVRRLAQEIIVTQQDEIRAMRLAIANHSVAPAIAGGAMHKDP